MEFNSEMYMSVYRHSPIGLVIADDSTDLVEINDYMLRMFHLERADYMGMRFGNVFHCSGLPEGSLCGTVNACITCELRAGVTGVLSSEAPISDIVIDHSFVIDCNVERKWFKVSANAISPGDRKFAVISFVDITQEKRYEELLLHELTLDLATGVMNKHCLLEILKGLAGSTDSNSAISIGIIDFDDFKVINDRYGHLAGDRVLTDFTNLARSTVRSNDIIGRYGGEEFMFILPGADIIQAAQVIQRIHRELNAQLSGSAPVSFSAGFVQLDFQSLALMNVNDIIKAVDGYMYAAKNAGKRRFASQNLMIELE